MSNPFAAHSLPSPTLTDAEARQLLHERFAVEGTLSALGSHQDQNWRVDAADTSRLVLKVSNPGFPTSGLHAQNAAMLHLSTSDFPYDLPLPRADRDGALVSTWQHEATTLDVRLVSYVDGAPLSDFGYLAPPVLRAHGQLAARAAVALSDFDHDGLDRLLQWDCRHAASVVTALLEHVGDDSLSRLVNDAMTDAGRSLDLLSPRLRTGVVHADVTDVNVVARTDDAGRPMPGGLIDFGDISRTWSASDAAVAAVGLIGHDLTHPLQLVGHVAAGYHEVLPLTEPEVDALWPLVVARAALCIVSSEQQARLDPHSEYARRSCAEDAAIMRAVAAVPTRLATAQLRHWLGQSVAEAFRPPAQQEPLVAGAEQLPVRDLSATAVHVTPGVVAPPTQPSVTRYGLGEVARAVLDQPDETATVPLGVEVAVRSQSPVLAPFGATVHSTGLPGDAPGWVALAHDEHLLVVHGVRTRVASGDVLAAGEVLGVADDADGLARLWVQWQPTDVPVPRFAVPSLFGGWARLCPDPSESLGRPAHDGEQESTPSGLLARRNRVIAPVQEHYYATPPRIERGWRHHLFDTDGRAYLDMVNNVAGVGHSHPAVTEAVTRQLQLLNTNSRFNYEAMVAYSERLSDLLPESLDTVFLVSTGSEALDLALRIATTATGAEHVAVVRSAYHGWTTATDAISTSIADNPDALTTRPPWVHLVDSPNTYRGSHRGEDAAQRYADDVGRALAEVHGSGGSVAAFVAEALYGNAGGVELPDGYLSAAYAKVRDAGGLCIADEVQVGYARTGDHFWAFEDHGVVPDIVCAAKAAGNGVALGAVVTRREIADRFARQGSFFSSVGGSPVSCAAGLAVLDVIRDEQLQRNAQVVGGRLRDQLRALAARHDLIGAVHGKGLYLGVELVRDHASLEPATAECAAICERMLDLGVVVQPTSDYLNVLKVKPPLCLTASSADFFVETLDHCLTTGW